MLEREKYSSESVQLSQELAEFFSTTDGQSSDFYSRTKNLLDRLPITNYFKVYLLVSLHRFSRRKLPDMTYEGWFAAYAPSSADDHLGIVDPEIAAVIEARHILEEHPEHIRELFTRKRIDMAWVEVGIYKEHIRQFEALHKREVTDSDILVQALGTADEEEMKERVRDYFNLLSM